VDRTGNTWVVFDIDGTREAARQRALPQTDDLPPAFRRLDDVGAPGYTGRKRGQAVRTRSTESQAHSYQWLGSFGNRGNGQYRVELRQGLATITQYLTAHQSHQRARWCDWMDNMAWESWSQTSLPSPSSPEAKSTACWITY
jgi:hypothetical protein